MNRLPGNVRRRGGWMSLMELNFAVGLLLLFLPAMAFSVAEICADRDVNADRLRGAEEARRLFALLQADSFRASAVSAGATVLVCFTFDDGSRAEYRESGGMLVRDQGGQSRHLARAPRRLDLQKNGQRSVLVHFVPAQSSDRQFLKPWYETTLCIGERR